MGDRPVLTGHETTGPGPSLNLDVDTAVFTSIRSPMGEGYRIVATSGGLRPEEKADLTRRSPSHGNLLDDGGEDGPSAVASYRLSTGRRAVAYSCSAGQEHTARGGQRIYTQIAILDEPTFAQAGADPFALAEGIAQHIASAGKVLKPLPRITPMSLEVSSSKVPTKWHPDWTAWFNPVLKHLLVGGKAILVGIPRPVAFMTAVVRALPVAVRASFELSVNLKYAPARQCPLMLMSSCDHQLSGQVAGHDVAIWSVDREPPAPAEGPDRWCALVQQWYARGRAADVVRLTGNVAAELGAGALDGVAAICEDLDRVVTAVPAEQAPIVERYRGCVPANGVEADLVRQILNFAESAEPAAANT